MMTSILCLGFGFCANGLWHDAREYPGAIQFSMAASYRDEEKKHLLQQKKITPYLFGDSSLTTALAENDVWLISAAPGADGDPMLARYGDRVEKLAGEKKIIYLSTTGVYGNHDGAWVDETSILKAQSQRGQRRIDAEQAWQGHGATILRLGGIYGPLLDGMGQNTLQSILDGTARRIEKNGQVFGRIHVADIARAIDKLLQKNIKGEVFNLVDDEPANPRAVVDYGFALLGRDLPPLENFEEAKHSMSPMAQSFFADNKRVRNDKCKKILGWQPQYPSYREGLTMIKNRMTT